MICQNPCLTAIALLIAHSLFDGIQLMASLLSTTSSSFLHQQDPIMGYELTESRTETNVDILIHIHLIQFLKTSNVFISKFNSIESGVLLSGIRPTMNLPVYGILVTQRYIERYSNSRRIHVAKGYTFLDCRSCSPVSTGPLDPIDR